MVGTSFLVWEKWKKPHDRVMAKGLKNVDCFCGERVGLRKTEQRGSGA